MTAMLTLIAAVLALGAVVVVQAVLHSRAQVAAVAAGPLAPVPPPATIAVVHVLAQQPRRMTPPVPVPPAELAAVMRVTPVIVPAEPRFVISKTRLLLYTITASTTILAFVELSPWRPHFQR